MLVSDLHLTDESTAINVDPSAFKLLGEEIAAGYKSRGAQEMHLVLLGDIYDLVRTDYWLRNNIAPESRPWGVEPGKTLDPKTGMNPHPLIEVQFNNILIDILAKPSGVALKELVARLPGVAPKVTYVIGNHDRVFNNFDSLKQLVRTNLGVDVTFTNQLVEPSYGVAARHGHEWDKDCHAWEYITKVQKRRVDRFDPSTYRMMAIGEAITAELMGGLVYRVRTALDPQNANDRDFVQQIKDVNNLRPMSEALRWVSWFTQGQGPRYLDIVLKALIESLEDLLASALARQWDKVKTAFLVSGDTVDILQTGRKALKARGGLASLAEKVSVLQWIAGAKDRVSAFLGLDKGDTYVNGARQEFDAGKLPAEIQYIAYGHTHLARHDCFKGALSGKVQLYANTGTYLPLIERTLDGKGFWRAYNMTMLFCYLPDRAGDGPTVDIWDGIRRKVSK